MDQRHGYAGGLEAVREPTVWTDSGRWPAVQNGVRQEQRSSNGRQNSHHNTPDQ